MGSGGDGVDGRGGGLGVRVTTGLLTTVLGAAMPAAARLCAREKEPADDGEALLPWLIDEDTDCAAEGLETATVMDTCRLAVG